MSSNSMIEPPAIFLFDVILKRPVYNDNCNCEVIALRLIAKSELNFSDYFFYQFCQVISTVI